MKEFSAPGNPLGGSIPNTLGHWKTLDTFFCGGCNLYGDIPRSLFNLSLITGFSLAGNQLTGSLPPTMMFPNLVVLQLWGNQLTGPLPPSISNCSRLEYLEMTRNEFSGKLEIDFEKLREIEYIKLGNNNFGSKEEDEMKFIGSLKNCTRLKQLDLSNCKFQGMLPTSIGDRFLKVSYDQLLKATNGFSEANLIGKGGFSSVFKGILDVYENRIVAVKVIHLQNRGAQSSFMRECEAWRSIRHRNLLRIITSCSSIDFQGNDFKALVYEFMTKGSLQDWLHSSEGTSALSLLQRINILMGVAFALDYIHNHCIPAIVHGDLKPSNILLDDDMVAHVGDFGLTRFLGTSYLNSSTGIRGTIGYVPPEYGLGNEMSSTGDVYSFGILLLEIMTGKKPTDDIFKETLSIHNFASMALPDHVMDAIDASMLNAYEENETFMKNREENVKKIEECMALTLKIGISCTLDSPSERMDMKRVAQELQHIMDTLQSI